LFAGKTELPYLSALANLPSKVALQMSRFTLLSFTVTLRCAYRNDVAARRTGGGLDVAVDDGPALDVGLDGLFGEVDQTQPGHVHSAVVERRNRHLADALPAAPYQLPVLF